MSLPPTTPSTSPGPDRPRFCLTRLGRENLVILGCLALLLIYGSFRQRYIWGVDSYGYFELGRLLSTGTVFLEAPLAGLNHPALVPLGFLPQADGLGAPNYPPGFPVLLGIGHLLGAPLWVTPAIGVISCLLLFGLLREKLPAGHAWLFTLAWALMPVTVFGSTMLMSDLAAAAALLGGLLAFRRGRPALAAWVLGFGVAIRPTNVLFFLPFALLLGRDRPTLRFLLHLSVPAALYAAYNHLLYGAPWRTGYGHVAGGLSPEIFPSFFGFFAWTTVLVLSPLILALAAIGLRPWNREKLFLLLWPLVFMVFYSFWAGGGNDRWWWARFVLPGYGAFFILAADGYAQARRWLADRWPGRGARLAGLALALAVGALPVYFVRFGIAQGDLWNRDTGAINHQVAQAVTREVPPGSLVGTVELASTFRLYSDVVPFVLVHGRALELVEAALAQGRRVFLLPEPWHEDDQAILRLKERFAVRRVARYERLWGGLSLYEVTRP